MPLLHVIPNLTRSLLCQLRQLKTSNNDKHSELAMKVTLDNICNSCDVVSFLSAVQLNKNLQKIIPPLSDIPPWEPPVLVTGSFAVSQSTSIEGFR